MADDTPITLYVSDDEKRTLRREADQADMSLSAYCKQLLRRQRRDEATADMAEQLNPEERFNTLVADAKEEIAESVGAVEDVADDLREMQARSGVYAIANFELLKQQYADPLRRDALATGKRRLQLPVREHDISADTPDRDTDDPDDVDESDAGSDDLDDRLNMD